MTVVQAPQSSQNIRHLRVDSRLQYECVRRYLHDCRSLSKEFKFSDIAVDDDNVHIDGKRESVLEHHRNDPSPAETPSRPLWSRPQLDSNLFIYIYTNDGRHMTQSVT